MLYNKHCKRQNEVLFIGSRHRYNLVSVTQDVLSWVVVGSRRKWSDWTRIKFEDQKLEDHKSEDGGGGGNRR